jgi:hypothetical protein
MATFQKCTGNRLRNVGLALAAVLLVGNAGSARADILLTLASVTPSGNDYQYTYDALLTSGSVLQAAGGGVNTGVSPSNNYFTLYGVQGLVAGSITYGGALGIAGNSAFSVQNAGVTPPGETPLPPDLGSAPNITTYWMGAPLTATNASVDIGTFSFLDTNALGSGMLAYSAATQALELLATGGIANNVAQVMGPGGAAPAAPEPATLMLLGIALSAIGGFCYRRRTA